jgi:hypothetical protein
MSVCSNVGQGFQRICKKDGMYTLRGRNLYLQRVFTMFITRPMSWFYFLYDVQLPRHCASSGCGWRVAANILNKQSLTADKGWSSCLGVGRGANNSSP